MKRILLALCAAFLALAAIEGAIAAPKNVILMITDGRSYGVVDATRAWTGKKPPYAGRGWTRYYVHVFGEQQ
jgi:alkaline phosphatase